MSNDVLNVAVALIVIFGIVRWWNKPGQGGPDGPAATNNRGTGTPSLGFRPRNVTPGMIAAVQQMFPQEPRANIHYYLLRTGDQERAVNELLDKGSLPAPPAAYYALYPLEPPANARTSSTNTPTNQSSASTSQVDLITRYDLKSRLEEQLEPSALASSAGGKAAWLDTKEKREQSLRERKAQMVLAARQKLLAKQKAAAT